MRERRSYSWRTIKMYPIEPGYRIAPVYAHFDGVFDGVHYEPVVCWLLQEEIETDTSTGQTIPDSQPATRIVPGYLEGREIMPIEHDDATAAHRVLKPGEDLEPAAAMAWWAEWTLRAMSGYFR